MQGKAVKFWQVVDWLGELWWRKAVTAGRVPLRIGFVWPGMASYGKLSFSVLRQSSFVQLGQGEFRLRPFR